MREAEQHRTNRVGWLRAAVLGANDGIVSTASLIVGVAAAESTRNSVLVAGIAGLVAGAMSMAAGEYVSPKLSDSFYGRRILCFSCRQAPAIYCILCFGLA